jgi:hypothetical protein
MLPDRAILAQSEPLSILFIAHGRTPAAKIPRRPECRLNLRGKELGAVRTDGVSLHLDQGTLIIVGSETKYEIQRPGIYRIALDGHDLRFGAGGSDHPEGWP